MFDALAALNLESGNLRFLLMIIQISAGMSISYLVCTPVRGLGMCLLGFWGFTDFTVISWKWQVSEYLVDESAPLEQRLQVFRYYGSFTKTLLTMFEAGLKSASSPLVPSHVLTFFKISYQETSNLSLSWFLRLVREGCHFILTFDSFDFATAQQVLFANWAPPCRVLIDYVSEWYTLVFVIYRSTKGFLCLVGLALCFCMSGVRVQLVVVLPLT